MINNIGCGSIMHLNFYKLLKNFCGSDMDNTLVFWNCFYVLFMILFVKSFSLVFFYLSISILLSELNDLKIIEQKVCSRHLSLKTWSYFEIGITVLYHLH